MFERGEKVQCRGCHTVFHIGLDFDGHDRIPPTATHCYKCGAKL